ncbi:MAG: twin-arginine translocase TatA/TatE family subunit [Candidatus Electrothrix sp. ATG2]|nr:twin-arginine translocase TatA/TatE family subunit [Candidatus Electrothrix sp. ATG2]
MFGLGMTEMIIILVSIVILFGAGKLPEIGAGLGQGIRNFKDSTKELEEPKEQEEGVAAESSASQSVEKSS